MEKTDSELPDTIRAMADLVLHLSRCIILAVEKYGGDGSGSVPPLINFVPDSRGGTGGCIWMSQLHQ